MLLYLRRLWIVCAQWLKALFVLFFPVRKSRFGRRKTKTDKKTYYHRHPKPAWVKKEIIRLKTLMIEAGCRKIAYTFNRKFVQCEQMTVSKTYVNEVIRKYNYEIQILRLKIKNRVPKPVPKNLIWGMDLIGKKDEKGVLHSILGIIEHKSRASLN